MAQDLFARPVTGAPGARITVMERTRDSDSAPLQLTEGRKELLNLGSYNYLGFAAQDPYCTPRVLECQQQLGWSTCSSRSEAGTTPVHQKLEKLVAEFLGHEDAITYGMGFASNTSTIPCLVGDGCLVLSDSLNHASIVAGVRLSGAKVKVFRHNDMAHLEELLRSSIAEGQPRTHRPWKKVLIIIEGIYSMEGEIAPLREIVALKKQYKAYLYIDEAHSIGGLGAQGRGVCEATGVDPRDVDVLMGTFTKGFGSTGGYVAGSAQLIRHLRRNSPAHLYATAMSAPAVEQCISALQLMLGRDGTNRGQRKLAQLRSNSNFFRRGLMAMGLDVLGDFDSPIMPVVLYNPGKVAAFSRLAYERGIAITMVGYPATPLLKPRSRICISASHSRADLEWALREIAELARECAIIYKQPSQAGWRRAVAQLRAASQQLRATPTQKLIKA